jgi:hypothetical protein
MTDINTWSPTDASNNDAPPAGWPEGMLPSGVNDAARAMMGGLRRWYERVNWAVVTGGTANALSLAYPVPSAVLDGDVYLFVPEMPNTGSTTIDVNGLGPLPIYQGEAELRGGELQKYVPVLIAYSQFTGRFQLIHAPVELPLIGSLGVPNAQTLTYTTGAPTTLAVGDRFTFYPLVATNTGPTTLNVQGLGVYHVLAGGLECAGGELKQYVVIDVVWDGTQFQLVGGVPAGTYLPVAGGVVNGTISAIEYDISGTRFALRNGDSNQLFDGDGGESITMYGAAGGNINYYDADQHQIRLNNASTLIATISASGLGVTGQVTGTSMSSPTITATGVMNAASIQVGGITFVLQSGTQRAIHDTGGTPNFTMYTSGENYYQNQSHSFQKRGGGAPTYALFDGSGVYNAANSAAWTITSDVSLKENIEPYSRGLAALLQLQPVSYRFAAGTPLADEAGTTRYGLVAQDVETVVPEMVGETTLGEERVSTLDVGNLFWILTNAVKELAARVSQLEGESDV